MVEVIALIGGPKVRLCGACETFSKVSDTWAPVGTSAVSGTNWRSLPVSVPIVSWTAPDGLPAGLPLGAADSAGGEAGAAPSLKLIAYTRPLDSETTYSRPSGPSPMSVTTPKPVPTTYGSVSPMSPLALL